LRFSARRPLTDEERYQRLAEKRNRKAEQDHPLFAYAGLLHEVTHIWTAGDVRREFEAYAAKLERCSEEMAQDAERLRWEFAAVATPEELAKADDYWQGRVERWGDPGPAYRCDYWWQALRDLELRDMPVQITGYGYRNAFGQLVVVTDLYSGGEKWVSSVCDQRKGIWEPWLLGCRGGWPTREEAQAELDRAAEAAGWRREEVDAHASVAGVDMEDFHMGTAHGRGRSGGGCGVRSRRDNPAKNSLPDGRPPARGDSPFSAHREVHRRGRLPELPILGR